MWSELLGRRYVATVAVLAGGVALYATNVYVTTSVLPSVVSDIGGQRFYAWVTTAYLITSVSAATTVHSLLGALGPRGAYLVAFTSFALGTLACAVAPSMPALLAGRVIQGAAGGLLAGLAYAVINVALPQHLWTRASAFTSAMWGVGTFVGPATGGLFAQFHVWRWAFGTLAVLAAACVVVVPRVLPARTVTGRASWRIPLRSLVVLTTAALLAASAGLQSGGIAMTGFLAASVVFVAVFLWVDRSAPVRVLPAAVFDPGPPRWIYLTIAVLSAASMAETFIPFFGQVLGHLAPLVAGFLGAALALGWTIGEMFSAAAAGRRTVARIVAVAPATVALGLVVAGASQRAGAGAAEIGMWAVGFAIAGAGIGMAWPHLATAAMSAVPDPEQGAAAAAAISTVQLVAGALGAGLAGMLVNLGGESDTRAAQFLYLGLSALAAAGVAVSTRVFGTHRARRMLERTHA